MEPELFTASRGLTNIGEERTTRTAKREKKRKKDQGDKQKSEKEHDPIKLDLLKETGGHKRS